MKNKKTIRMSGFAFDFEWLTSLFSIKWGEEADMEKLATEAKNGWIVTGMKGFRFELTKGEPAALSYSIDYKDQPDKEYFEIFSSSGWTHIGSIDYIHLFKAQEGTTPIYTDMETKFVKLSHEMRRYGLLFLVATLLLIGANMLTNWAMSVQNSIFLGVTLFLTLIALLFVVFTILPFWGYWSRVNKLKKKRI